MRYYRQESDWTCGPAVMRMVLSYFGIDVPEKELEAKLGTTPDAGTESRAFVKVLEEYGLVHEERMRASLDHIEKYLADGWLVIVGYRMLKEDEGHYALVHTIDDLNIALYDPDRGPDHTYTREEFYRRWKLGFKREEGSNWLVAIRK